MIDQAGAIVASFVADDLRVTGKASPVANSTEQQAPAVLVATSGTTGRAKLVKLSDKALMAAADASADRLGWTTEDRLSEWQGLPAPTVPGSQFFICVADSPFLDRQYTVFGEVVSGMDVVDKIVSQPEGRE